MDDKNTSTKIHQLTYLIHWTMQSMHYTALKKVDLTQ